MTTSTSAPPQLLMYPGAQLRPVPAFALLKPQGWAASELPGAVITIGAPDVVDGIWINAMVAHERVLATVALELAVQATWALTKRSSPDATILSEVINDFDGRRTYLRGAELPAVGEVPAIGQMYAAFFGPDTSHPTVDLFQILCTAPADRIEGLIPTFMSIIESFTFL